MTYARHELDVPEMKSCLTFSVGQSRLECENAMVPGLNSELVMPSFNSVPGANAINPPGWVIVK